MPQTTAIKGREETWQAINLYQILQITEACSWSECFPKIYWKGQGSRTQNISRTSKKVMWRKLSSSGRWENLAQSCRKLCRQLQYTLELSQLGQENWNIYPFRCLCCLVKAGAERGGLLVFLPSGGTADSATECGACPNGHGWCYQAHSDPWVHESQYCSEAPSVRWPRGKGCCSFSSPMISGVILQQGGKGKK